jgi:hypothetical protein
MFIAEDPTDLRVRVEQQDIYDLQGRLLHPKRRGVHAKFKRGVAPGWVVDLAARTFEFRKKPVEMSVGRWVAFYDSVEDQANVGWSDEERQEIEAKLRGFPDVLEVEPEQVGKPWPTIENHRPIGKRTAEMSAQLVASVAEQTGISLDHVISYIEQEGWPAGVAEALRSSQPAEPVEELVEA